MRTSTTVVQVHANERFARSLWKRTLRSSSRTDPAYDVLGALGIMLATSTTSAMFVPPEQFLQVKPSDSTGTESVTTSFSRHDDNIPSLVGLRNALNLTCRNSMIVRPRAVKSNRLRIKRNHMIIH